MSIQLSLKENLNRFIKKADKFKKIDEQEWWKKFTVPCAFGVPPRQYEEIGKGGSRCREELLNLARQINDSNESNYKGKIKLDADFSQEDLKKAREIAVVYLKYISSQNPH